MGAPVGNQNAAKAKVWLAAIHRALEKRSKGDQKAALDELAEVLLSKCQEGDMGALKELGDRLDGKAVQAVSGPEGGPVEVKGYVIVTAKHPLESNPEAS